MDFSKIEHDGETFIVGAFTQGRGIKTIRSDHVHFGLVKHLLELTPEELEDKGEDFVVALFDPAAAISKTFEELTERITFRNNAIFFDGDQLNSTITDHVIRLMWDDEDFMPYVFFLENVMENPVQHSREQSFDWITAAGDGMTITEDGMVVGFKGTHGDGNGGFESTTAGHAIVNGEEYNGRIPYAVGDVVTMPRSEVTHDPGTSCSTGLHVGTRRYAKRFLGNGGALLEVWVNPRDIVSVPSGEHEKMRVCRFYIVGEVDDDTVYTSLRRREDVYVSPTESPYDADEFGDGEELAEADDFAPVLAPYPQDLDDEDLDDEDYDEDDEPTLRNPTANEFDTMRARAKKRHRGSPGTASFAAYATSVGVWKLTNGDGSEKHHWLIEA